jgi:hypothetical protein
MQSTFSDVFFDAFTGELKTLEDYVNSFSRSIARSLSDILSKQLVEGLFATGTPGGGAAAGGGWLGQFGRYIASVFHDGGVVGRDDAARRTVPSAVFAAAPRLHDGLMPNEFPAILQKGETVFTPGQLKAMGAGSGRRVNVNNNFYITAPGGRVAPQSVGQVQAGVYTSIVRAAKRNN